MKIGAASAGLGAALLGFSLIGPSGVAAADTNTDSSSSSPASTAGPSTSGVDTDASDPSDPSDAPDPSDDSDADSTDDAADADIVDVDPAQDDADVDDSLEPDRSNGSDSSGESDADSESASAEADSSAKIKRSTTRSTVNLTGVPSAAVEDGPAAEPVPAPPWLKPRPTWDETVAKIMTDWTARHEAWVESLAVSDARKAELAASFTTMRRGLFNQAPTVAPIQLSGLITGAITGAINGVDAEGDTIVYRLVRGPRSGSVVINDDGTYTYTPGTDFDGVDTFYVRAVDTGLHINLLNLFRPIGTRATNLINQGAITFNFKFTGADWTDERQEALREVAASLQQYFRVNAPVTLDYNVNLEDPTQENRSLASATSPYVSVLPGYWRTVVQQKLLTGRDANGSKADGEISWNFVDYEWALGDNPTADEYDFVSTAIHEIMHSFGFLSSLGEAGDNAELSHGIYDRRLVTVRGHSPFFFASWRRFNDPKLTGEDGGLYFGGRHAVAAYGGLVPIYTPAEFEPGSSLHHLDDLTFTGDKQKIMNAATDTGLGVRVFSAVEIGILKDLGYNIVMPQSPPYSMALLGFVFLARKRSKSKAAAR